MLRTLRTSSRKRLIRVARLLPVALLLAACGDAQPSPPTPTPGSSPLPHSMKGYELYSWPAPDGLEWTYALITGTNRLKRYDEVVSAQDQVTTDGVVALSVVGAGDLKALLVQLPPGEEVFWIDGDWLRAVGADPAMVETMGLPDDRIIAEIQHLCQEIGVQLHVERATE